MKIKFIGRQKSSQSKASVEPSKNADEDHISLKVSESNNDVHVNKSPITLSWENLSYTIGGKSKGDAPKELLQQINGWINPGEVIAIMGASGAGKYS